MMIERLMVLVDVRRFLFAIKDFTTKNPLFTA